MLKYKSIAMLKLNLAPLIREKGSTKAQAFLRKHGFTAREARSLMNTKGIRLVKDSTILRLCEALVCEPNDLFQWIGPKESSLAKLNVATQQHIGAYLARLPQQAVTEKVQELLKAMEDIETPQTKIEGRLFLNVGRLVAERQQASALRFLIENGFTRMEANKLLDPKRVAFKLTMLSRLCVCFNCMPNELFDWDGPNEHFLSSLKKVLVIDLRTEFEKLPPAVVRRLMRG